MSASQVSPARRHFLDTLGLAVVALGVYVALGQDTFYRNDGRHILKMLMSGLLAHPNHVLYVPAVRGALALGLGLWPSLYVAALAVSQVGAALGVGLMHRAGLRLGLGRGAALAAAGLVATAPAVLFFATVVELHGFFLLFVGLAALAGAHFAAAPGWRRAIPLGLATALAVGAHATGHLLPFALMPLAFRQGRRPYAGSAVVLLTHAAAALAMPLCLRAAGLPVQGGAAPGFLLAMMEMQGLALSALPMLVWRDWLVPFAPLSVLAWFAWRSARAETLGLLVAVGAYLGATLLLLGDATEHGAYVLPLAWPAAVLTVRALRPWVWGVAAAVGFSIGVAWVVGHDQPGPSRAFAAAARTLAQTQSAMFFAGTFREFDAFLIHAPELKWKDLIDDASLPPGAIPTAMPLFAAWVRSERASGVVVYLTEGVFEYLAAPTIGPHPETGPVLARAMRDTFALVPVAEGAFRGFRVDLR